MTASFTSFAHNASVTIKFITDTATATILSVLSCIKFSCMNTTGIILNITINN